MNPKKKVKIIIKTLKMTDRTPISAILCRTPIYFLSIKIKFSRIAVPVTPAQTKVPRYMKIYLRLSMFRFSDPCLLGREAD